MPYTVVIYKNSISSVAIYRREYDKEEDARAKLKKLSEHHDEIWLFCGDKVIEHYWD